MADAVLLCAGRTLFFGRSRSIQRSADTSVADPVLLGCPTDTFSVADILSPTDMYRVANIFRPSDIELAGHYFKAYEFTTGWLICSSWRISFWGTTIFYFYWVAGISRPTDFNQAADCPLPIGRCRCRFFETYPPPALGHTILYHYYRFYLLFIGHPTPTSSRPRFIHGPFHWPYHSVHCSYCKPHGAPWHRVTRYIVSLLYVEYSVHCSLPMCA